MIERQPGNHDIVNVYPGRLDHPIDIGPDDMVGQHHSFGLRCGSRGELQHGEAAGIVIYRLVIAGRRRTLRPRLNVAEQNYRRIARSGLVESGHFRVDEQHGNITAF